MIRALLALSLCVAVPAMAAEIDSATGLKMAAGWEVTRMHCGGCHSYRLVTSQRGDADYWRSVIDWMQRTQNLWQIPPDQEGLLISYLSDNYNETEWGRRPPLSPSLLPPLPPAGPNR